MTTKHYGIIIILLFSCACHPLYRKKTSFYFVENEQGVELQEKGQSVFIYQKEPVTIGNNPVVDSGTQFNHYFHPVYNLSGEVITEAQPVSDKNHPHQRGIYWGWQQLYINDTLMGDGWIMEDFEYEIQNIQTKTDKNKAELLIQTQWLSKRTCRDLAFIKEKSRITVHSVNDERRIIDFEIGLTALVPDVSIGGSTDTTKGYGGFSARIMLADSMLFRTENGPVEPIRGQLNIGPWVDFSTPSLIAPQKYGFAIFCHPSIPNFPSPWLLRREGSMQNPAFPGSERIPVSMKQEIMLRYRIIIHNGEPGINKIKKWYSEYLKSSQNSSH